MENQITPATKQQQQPKPPNPTVPPSKAHTHNHRQIISHLLLALQTQEQAIAKLTTLTQDLHHSHQQLLTELNYDNGTSGAEMGTGVMDLYSYVEDLGNGIIGKETAVAYLRYRRLVESWRVVVRGLEKEVEEVEGRWGEVVVVRDVYSDGWVWVEDVRIEGVDGMGGNQGGVVSE